MATWNMNQYDLALKDRQREIDNEYRREQAALIEANREFARQQKLDEVARAEERTQYERNRQKKIDKQNAVLFDYKVEDLERADELAQAQHPNKLQNIAANQQLLTKTLQAKTQALDEAKNAKDYTRLTYDPYQFVLLKLAANNFSPASLTDEEKEIYLRQRHREKYDEELVEPPSTEVPDEVYFRTESQLRDAGVDPRFVPLHAQYLRVQQANNAKAAAVRQKAEQEAQYKSAKAIMTGAFNQLKNSGEFGDNKSTDSKQVVEAATALYIAGKGQITPEQAVRHAAGVKKKKLTPDEYATQLFGAQYVDFDDEEKSKVKSMLAKYAKQKELFERKQFPRGSVEELQGLRDLEEYWRKMANSADFDNWTDSYSDLKSPDFERLQHAEYDHILQELRVRENKLSEEFPRFYAWVKSNPNASILGRQMKNALLDDSMYGEREVITPKGDTWIETFIKPKYQKFFDELRMIQALRDQLVAREKRIAANRNRYVG